MRERREMIQKDKEYVLDVLEKGGKKAEKRIAKKWRKLEPKLV